MFESLWIDKPHAPDVIEKLGADPATFRVAQYLRHFHRFGYCIIPGAVAPEAIVAYNTELTSLIKADWLKISLITDILPAKGADLKVPLTKLLDVHVFSEAAQNIIFAPHLLQFLGTLFEGPPLAFQSLHFETGSTQAVHNDTAYVVVDEPKSLCASWVALEDIMPGSGELIYYPGGHRFGEFFYPNNRKNWNPPEDGQAIHLHHLHYLHEAAKAAGIELQTFRAKKRRCALLACRPSTRRWTHYSPNMYPAQSGNTLLPRPMHAALLPIFRPCSTN